MKYLMLLLLSSCTLEASLGDSERPSAQPAFGATRWSVVLGTGETETVDPNGIAFASDGDVIVGGTSWVGDVARGFVARREAGNGTAAWQVVLDGFTQVVAVTTTGESTIAVGSFTGTVDFGGQTLSTSTTTPGVTPASTDLFVASYAADGSLQWVRALGCTVLAAGYAVTATNSAIYVGGWFRGVVDVGAGAVGLATGWEQQTDGLLLAYSHAGQLQWGRTFTGGSVISDVGVLPGGDIVLTGSATAGTTYGGAAVSESGQLLARFGLDGSHQLSRVVGAGHIAMGLAIANDGNVILSRHRDATPGADTGNVRSLVDGNGDPLWTIATTKVEATRPVARGDGFVLGGTTTRASSDLGAGVVGLGVAYVAAYDLGGAVLDVRTFGDPLDAQRRQLTGVASAPGGELAFAVGIEDPIDFGVGSLAPLGRRSVAIILLDAP
jgi:hypothetical protein